MERHVIQWQIGDIHYTLTFRNVGEKNPDAKIQMTFERWNQHTDRCLPFICIDLPKEKADEFIKIVKIPESDN